MSVVTYKIYRGILSNPNLCLIAIAGVSNKYSINFHTSVNHPHPYLNLFKQVLNNILLYA